MFLFCNRTSESEDGFVVCWSENVLNVDSAGKCKDMVNMNTQVNKKERPDECVFSSPCFYLC